MKKLILGMTLVTLSNIAAIRNARSDDLGVLRVITGTISANGTPQNPTKEFTIAHPSRGRYIVTFSPFVFGKSIPACIVMPLGLLMVNAIYENVSYCDFTIVDFNGSPTDAIYNFMAAPITN
jgi:hypothetical protein